MAKAPGMFRGAVQDAKAQPSKKSRASIDPMLPQTPQETSADRSMQERAWMLVFAGWIVATASVLGALFFSEVMALPPCVLCWYQRICMFPLVILLPLGLFPFDPKVVRYALLSVITQFDGLLIEFDDGL
jgi:disulfide bond formation protein DsbB